MVTPTPDACLGVEDTVVDDPAQGAQEDTHGLQSTGTGLHRVSPQAKDMMMTERMARIRMSMGDSLLLGPTGRTQVVEVAHRCTLSTQRPA